MKEHLSLAKGFLQKKIMEMRHAVEVSLQNNSRNKKTHFVEILDLLGRNIVL